MKTNGHVWFGYEATEHVPVGKLSSQQVQGANELRHGIEVTDDRGFILAVFRNPTDADRYRKDMARLAIEADKKREAAYKVTALLPADGKAACPTCGKHVAWNGLKQHLKDAHRSASNAGEALLGEKKP